MAAEDARTYLGVSRATFYNLIHKFRVAKYQIPAHGRRVFFKKTDLEKLTQPILKTPSRGDHKKRRRSRRVGRRRGLD
jgi:excisionase family DNA binding protein